METELRANLYRCQKTESWLFDAVKRATHYKDLESPALAIVGIPFSQRCDM